MTTIKSIELNVDDHVDRITLSDGRVLEAWNGTACYSLPDEATGTVEVGAELNGSVKLGDGSRRWSFGPVRHLCSF